ncbi:MAG: hypothetical protein V2A58_00425 [Planctomycetota bacterium]
MEGEARVMTVLGPVRPEALGKTTMHEHVIADCSFSGNSLLKKIGEEDGVLDDLVELRRAGGKTLVELSCQGLSGDAAALQRLSRGSRVNIIASTGYYREIAYPEYVFRESADELAKRLTDDAENGIGETGVRPGMLGEFASHDDGEPGEHVEKVFQAASRAHLATGLPITTHCWAGRGAEWEIGILKDEGVDQGKVIIGHVGANQPEMENARWILDQGVNVSVDCIGYDERDGWRDFGDPERAALIKRFIEWGHLGQIVVGRDMMRKYHLRKHGGGGYAYLFNSFVDTMREAGITEAQVEAILVGNPRRILTCGRT